VTGAGILATGSYLPKREVTNAGAAVVGATTDGIGILDVALATRGDEQDLIPVNWCCWPDSAARRRWAPA
jgi:3-oxoacyl-[acyl-carrier-protein] synthase III